MIYLPARLSYSSKGTQFLRNTNATSVSEIVFTDGDIYLRDDTDFDSDLGSFGLLDGGGVNSGSIGVNGCYLLEVELSNGPCVIRVAAAIDAGTAILDFLAQKGTNNIPIYFQASDDLDNVSFILLEGPEGTTGNFYNAMGPGKLSTRQERA